MFQILGRRINWTQIGISVGDSIQYLLKRHPEIESVCIEAQEPIDLALQHIHNLAPNLAKIELISNGNIVCDFHSWKFRKWSFSHLTYRRAMIKELKVESESPQAKEKCKAS